jgi:filamentous hemagglutinin
MLTPHPASARLAVAMRHCLAHAKPWAGDAFRFTDSTYANLRDVATGEGARKAGARWNPKGSFRALYFSLTPETALAEVLAHRRSQNVPDAETTPVTLVACHAEVQRVLDLTGRRIRRLLGLTVSQVTGEPWRALQHGGQEALTQAIGRLACEAGFEGLLVPSAARAKGVNLILFADRLTADQLAVVHPEKLPRFRRRVHRRKRNKP